MMKRKNNAKLTLLVLLIGRGGDDSVYGDRSGNADIGWSITRSITTVGGVTTYDNSASAGGWTDAAVGAADVIYGGAGDDWIEGDQGNDIAITANLTMQLDDAANDGEWKVAA
jgi:hypothetical protein